MRLHRLISILLLVENKGMIKAKELADKLEISQRTVYRDIETLCEAGIPLITTKGPSGGISLTQGYSGGIRSLNEEDIMSIFLGGIGIQPDKSSELSIKLSNALLKLQKNLPSSQASALGQIGDRFYFDSTPWWGKSAPISYIDILIHSIVQNKRINISYSDMNGRLSERSVDPYGLVVKRSDWYLVGWCMRSNGMRIFKCDRIQACIGLDEAFSLPTDFSIGHFWSSHEASFKNLCADKEKYPVTVRLTEASLELLKDLEVYEMHQDEESSRLLVTINMYQPEYAYEKIMANLEFMEIIEPASLRVKIRMALQKLMHVYSNQT